MLKPRPYSNLETGLYQSCFFLKGNFNSLHLPRTINNITLKYIKYDYLIYRVGVPLIINFSFLGPKYIVCQSQSQIKHFLLVMLNL